MLLVTAISLNSGTIFKIVVPISHTQKHVKIGSRLNKTEVTLYLQSLQLSSVIIVVPINVCLISKLTALLSLQLIMEAIKPFLIVYNLFDKMKNNKDQFPNISDRLDALQKLVEFVQQKELHKLSDDVRKAWEKLTTIMESAKEVLTKFEKHNLMTHMVKSSDYKLEFENLNKSLTDAFVTLSGALHVHQEKKTLKAGGHSAKSGITINV